MWRKAVITFLVGLHLLPVTALRSFEPSNTPLPTPVEVRIQQPVNNTPQPANGLSIQDEVYADLAMQHELDHVSVYYFDDNPKNTVSINADKNWDPASTIKLYAAMYTFDQISHGKLNLDQNITIDAKNVAPSESYSNGYSPLSAGDSVTLYRLVDQMITQSDNTAFNTLLDLLNRQEVTKYIHDLGLTNSSVGAKLNLSEGQQQYESYTSGYGPNLITANDYAKAFVLIKGGRIPGSTDLFNILSRQRLNSMLPADLPKNVTVAHKTGELAPYYHDGGIIVDAARKYVLAVFSDMGDPAVVAHISQLVYTNDVNLVGINNISKPITEIPNAPIDPLVTEAKPQEEFAVLAASTQNISLPKVTASDVGIKATDLANTLSPSQLPPVIIPADSPLHLLVALGEQIRIITNPIPSVRANFEVQNMTQELAEANGLISKGNTTKANDILQNVNDSLAQLASDPNVARDTNLQNSIDAVSETRFSILGSEVKASSDTAQKVQLIKDIASQALDTSQNIKPFVADGVKETKLTQAPVVGEVTKTTADSITIKISDGSEVTKPLDNQIKTRDAGTEDSTVSNPGQIPVGSTVAVAGSFVLTNIAPESANPKAVTVLKVNTETNSIVIQGPNGIPQQIDLTAGTVIKGTDTSISLDQINPGDVIVVHGEALPATPSGAIINPTTNPLATPTPVGQTPGPTTTGSGSSGGNTNTPVASLTPIGQTPNPFVTATPSASKAPIASPTFAPKVTVTPIPVKTTAPAPTTVPKATTAPKVTPAPVIKGNVINVVPATTTAPTPKATPAPTIAPKK